MQDSQLIATGEIEGAMEVGTRELKVGLELRKAVFAIAGAVRPKRSQVKESYAKLEVVRRERNGQRECDIELGCVAPFVEGQ